MVFHGLSRAIQRAPSVQQALEHAAASAVFSLPEGLNAPLLAALLDERMRTGLGTSLVLITATGRESGSPEALHHDSDCTEPGTVPT